MELYQLRAAILWSKCRARQASSFSLMFPEQQQDLPNSHGTLTRRKKKLLGQKNKTRESFLPFRSGENIGQNTVWRPIFFALLSWSDLWTFFANWWVHCLLEITVWWKVTFIVLIPRHYTANTDNKYHNDMITKQVLDTYVTCGINVYNTFIFYSLFCWQ